MPHYRRANTTGATYFFTVVTYRRQAILCDTEIRAALRDGINTVRDKRPFTIDAWVLLPDHLHCVWTLPSDDADFATRWGIIKRHVSMACHTTHRRSDWVTSSKRKHRESTLWQRRYWEHRIRCQNDLERHLDYIHYNPVKHGLCEHVVDWPYSTFHRYVAQGIYPEDWTAGKNVMEGATFGE